MSATSSIISGLNSLLNSLIPGARRLTTLSLSVVLLCSMVVSGCARHSDRDWIIREFAVPQEVDLSVQSTPEDETHWADRKNLFLNATFKFTPTQFLEYNKALEAKSDNWHPLPLSPELKNAVATRFDSPLTSNALSKAAHGFYYLKSSNGTNLLKSSKRIEWQAEAPDIELAILNADSAELKVFVKQ